ncbi:MAG: AbrB/MazE/SpoVT family DNA-binding domain-containing protein [Lentisphaeria bacterium]
MVTTVTGKNQITIPAPLARELKITTGTRLEWSKGEDAGTVRLRIKPSADNRVRELRDLGAPYRVKAPKIHATLQRMREEE